MVKHTQTIFSVSFDHFVGLVLKLKLKSKWKKLHRNDQWHIKVSVDIKASIMLCFLESFGIKHNKKPNINRKKTLHCLSFKRHFCYLDNTSSTKL